MNLGFPLSRQVPYAPCIQRDRVEILAEFVVKFAREVSTLVFLRANAFACKPAIVSKQSCRLLFKRAAMQQFTLRLAIPAPREPCQADSEHDQGGWKFIELKTLEAARQGIRQLADFKAHADERRRYCQRKHADEVAPCCRVRRARIDKRSRGVGLGLGFGSHGALILLSARVRVASVKQGLGKV